jgi:RHS repeat-associated protein
MSFELRSPMLLATDRSGSVLRRLGAELASVFTYSPFGYHYTGGAFPLSGFNGEVREPITRGYLLGNGYRLFNPSILRFNIPDSFSPFGKGGLNAYVYCAGDPVNRADPSGHVGLRTIFRRFTRARDNVPSAPIGLSFRPMARSADDIATLARAPTSTSPAAARGSITSVSDVGSTSALPQRSFWEIASQLDGRPAPNQAQLRRRRGGIHEHDIRPTGPNIVTRQNPSGFEQRYLNSREIPPAYDFTRRIPAAHVDARELPPKYQHTPQSSISSRRSSSTSTNSSVRDPFEGW